MGHYITIIYAAQINAFFYILEKARERIIGEAEIVFNAAQTHINKVTGSDKVVLQDKLNNMYVAAVMFGKLTPTKPSFMDLSDRYVGTGIGWQMINPKDYNTTLTQASIFMAYTNSMQAGLDELYKIRDNTEYVWQAQEAKAEEDRREAEQLYNIATEKLEYLTGTARSIFANEITVTLSIAHDAQIAAFNVLIPKIDDEILAQEKARKQAELDALVAQMMDKVEKIRILIPQIVSNNLRDKWQAELDKTIPLPSDHPSKDQYLKDILWNVQWVVLKETYSGMVVNINKSLTQLPPDYKPELITELGAIGTATDTGTHVGLRAGIDKLTVLLPKVDTALASYHAYITEENARIEEEARLAELALIKKAQEEQKEIEILEAQQAANDLIVQLPEPLQNSYLVKIEQAENKKTTTEQLAAYIVVANQMVAAIEAIPEIEQMTPEEITGIQDDIINSPLDSIEEELIATEIIIQDTQELPEVSTPDPETQPPTAATGLAKVAVPVAAGLALINFL